MSGTQLKTGISRVRWCDPDDGRYTISSAVMPGVMTGDEGDDEKDGMSWFDEMFRGGIELPKEGEKQRAVTLLITGPPGTGKSTLAMELCVRLATRPGIQQLGGKTLYVASEAHPPWMIGNAKSFGWVMGESKIPLFSMGPGPSRSPISICTLSDVQTGIGDFFANMRHLMSLDGSVGMRGTPNTENLELVVIDSLNSVETDKAKKFEEFYQKFVEGGPRLIVFVLDSSPSRPVAETWEFAADIVVRLDKDDSSGYMIRTLEIVKARYQAHVWGKHQLKIYGARRRRVQNGVNGSLADPETRMRAHPWAEGGIFIFPSIHYILSRFKRAAPARHGMKTVSTPLTKLNELLGGGIPAGRTTALLGFRGAHKSHLGYLQALHNVTQLKGKSIIVSLRDDEETTIGTLKGFLKQLLPKAAETADDSLRDLLDKGDLEIVNYMPGYVTPEEFFHRMLLSIYRMRQKDPECQITLLFNSLDQIASRFPLCAKEKVFIPGILQTLSSLGVTSIFVGADTEGADEGLCNLLSMAELILRIGKVEDFKRERFKKILAHAAAKSFRHASEKDRNDDIERLPECFPIAELTVERYAGGKPAGLQGMLELVSSQSLTSSVLADGLQFIPYRASHKTLGRRDQSKASEGK